MMGRMSPLDDVERELVAGFSDTLDTGPRSFCPGAAVAVMALRNCS